MKLVYKILTVVCVFLFFAGNGQAQNDFETSNTNLFDWDQLRSELTLLQAEVNSYSAENQRQGGQCDSITGLKTDIISLQTVNLSWSKNPQAEKYVVRGKKLPVGQVIYVDVPAGQDSLVISGMQPNREYSWQVLAVCDTAQNVTSNWSVLDTFRPICISPEGLFASNITSTTVRLNWDPIIGAAQYKVRGRPVGSPFWGFFVTSAINNFYDITGLQPGTTFQWGVRTHCDAFANRTSVYSGNQVFTTTTFNRIAAEQPVGVELQPNPTKGKIDLQVQHAGEASDYKLNVVSMIGEQMYLEVGHVENGINVLKIDLSAVANGLYFIQLEIAGETHLHKVVKQ